jgi:hypothetical protein
MRENLEDSLRMSTLCSNPLVKNQFIVMISQIKVLSTLRLKGRNVLPKGGDLPFLRPNLKLERARF